MLGSLGRQTRYESQRDQGVDRPHNVYIIFKKKITIINFSARSTMSYAPTSHTLERPRRGMT